MDICPAFDPAGPYVSSVLAYADCRALALGADGYAALGPGTAFGATLTGLLTIVVALVGYRLLLGVQFALREALGVALKLGAVLALASQWPAYRTVIFATFTSGPAELAGALLGQSGLAAPGGLGGLGGLAARVDGVNAAIADLVRPQAVPQLQPPPQALPAPGQGAAVPPPAAVRLLPETAQRSVESAAGTLTLTALGGLLAARVVAGVLLALGPLFLACLLFPVAAGLFAGWLRGLVGAGLAAVAAAAVLALDLAVIEPQVLALRALVDGGQSLGPLPMEIFATATAFAVVMLGAMLAAAWVGAGLAWPTVIAGLASGSGRGAVLSPPASAPAGTLIERQGEPAPPRARQLADAFAALDRREAAMPAAERVIRMAGGAAAPNAPTPATTPRLGQAARRTQHRQSASAGRRDAMR